MLVVVFLQRMVTEYNRPFWCADVLAAYIAGVIYGICALLCARPVLACFVTVLLFGLLALVNSAKKKVLRGEALLFSDVTLIRQVFHYPKLYLPYLPTKYIQIGLLLFVPMVYVLWHFSLVSSYPLP